MKRYLIVILAALLLLCGTVCAAAEDSEAPAPQVMTTVDQSTPRLMVTGYLLAEQYVAPGSTTALTITFKNTSNTKSIRNIKFTLTDPSGELMPDGMGTLYLEANNTNDYPLMMGIMIFMSGFALIANLLTDFCYGLLDPRVTMGERR